MERIRWTEKSITLRNLVDNPAIEKPALVQIGTKSIIVGEKIHGQFILASPCKVTNDRFDVLEQEIVLSSKHTGLWRVISKSTCKKEGHIHRLTTQNIENIHKQDVQNERPTPRSYISMKKIEVLELHMRSNDSSVFNGHRIERRTGYIEENVEFQVDDIGEVEYTPTEGERTSQDFITVPKSKSNTLLQFLIPNMQGKEQLIRNRVFRSLHCTTKNQAHKRYFLLEVNEQSCDIRPVASEGSKELRYLQSTQNLFEYMLKYGNDTSLYVKLLQGDPPMKAVEFDGHLIFKSILKDDQIPICRLDDLSLTLIDPDVRIRMKLPIGDQTWRSLSDVHTAERQCMQLSLALLARHESEMYVTVVVGQNTAHFLQSNDNQQEQRTKHSRHFLDTIKTHSQNPVKQISKFRSQDDVRREQRKSMSSDLQKVFKSSTPKLSRVTTLVHPASDELYRNEEKRLIQTNRQHLEKDEKSHQISRKNTPEKSILLLSPLFSNRNKYNSRHDSRRKDTITRD